MKHLRASVACALLVLLAAAGESRADYDAASIRGERGVSKIDNTGHCDVNSMDFVVTNHGSLMYDLTTGDAGLIYPRGTTKTAIFAAGLWLGAKVNDSLRVTVGEYSQEFSPGPMVGGASQPDNPRFKVYRVERGNTTSDDYINWPVQDGAPLDSAGNPLILGDVTLWSVYNDADPSVHSNRAGTTAPLGVEVQQTVFAFNQSNPLASCAFMKFLLINKGTNTLDSMFISFWSDPDLGDASDDLVGCDTTRSLGYVYNATNTDPIYGSTPPAFGFDFFQGPLINGLRLPMTSFSKYVNGTDPRSPSQSYNYMRGLKAGGEPYDYPEGSGNVVRFQQAGDPVTGEGDIDSNPADRRLQLTSGPFVMAPGDTQEIVVGVIVGQGANRLSSIRVLQTNDDFAQAAYDLDFNVAVPPPTPIVSVRPFDSAVELDWGMESEDYVSINSQLGQEYHFEGYNVYQGASIGGPWTKLLTFDVDDSIGILYDDVFSAETGAYQRVVVQNGRNTGLEYHVRLTNDAIRGGTLVNNREYFFAVTAYGYDVNNAMPFEVGGAVVGHVSPFPLESGIRPLRTTPAGSANVLREEAEHVSGPADAVVVLEYLDPTIVRDKNYRVTFTENDTVGFVWNLLEVNGAQTTTILENQTNFSGDYAYPVVNGIEVRVIGPTAGAKRIFQLCDDDGDGNTDRFKDLDNRSGSGNCTGEWFINTLTGDIGGLNRFEPLYNGNHDFEVRFVADTTEYAWDYFNAKNGESGRFPGKVPWQLWDIGINTPDDPSDDVRIAGMINESFDLSSPNRWSWYDGIYFRQIPYDSINWTDPNVNSITYDPADERISYGRLFFFRVEGDTAAAQPPAGTTVRLLTNKTITTGDVFEFRAKPVGSSDGTVISVDSQIYPIPNPYYNRSAYELNQFDRLLRFANLPPRKITVRIFDVGGDLVRTLARDDVQQGTVDWNLQNEEGITVGSGMYFWIAEVEGGKTQRGTMAVFIEKERLDTF